MKKPGLVVAVSVLWTGIVATEDANQPVCTRHALDEAERSAPQPDTFNILHVTNPKPDVQFTKFAIRVLPVGIAVYGLYQLLNLRIAQSNYYHGSDRKLRAALCAFSTEDAEDCSIKVFPRKAATCYTASRSRGGPKPDLCVVDPMSKSDLKTEAAVVTTRQRLVTLLSFAALIGGASCTIVSYWLNREWYHTRLVWTKIKNLYFESRNGPLESCLTELRIKPNTIEELKSDLRGDRKGPEVIIKELSQDLPDMLKFVISWLLTILSAVLPTLGLVGLFFTSLIHKNHTHTAVNTKANQKCLKLSNSERCLNDTNRMRISGADVGKVYTKAYRQEKSIQMSAFIAQVKGSDMDPLWLKVIEYVTFPVLTACWAVHSFWLFKNFWPRKGWFTSPKYETGQYFRTPCDTEFECLMESLLMKMGDYIVPFDLQFLKDEYEFLKDVGNETQANFVEFLPHGLGIMWEKLAQDRMNECKDQTTFTSRRCNHISKWCVNKGISNLRGTVIQCEKGDDPFKEARGHKWTEADDTELMQGDEDEETITSTAFRGGNAVLDQIYWFLEI